MNRLSVARVLIIAIFVIGGGVSGADKIGRPVTVVSIGFHGKTLEEVTELVNREGAKGADIIALPETFLGQKQNQGLILSQIEPLDTFQNRNRVRTGHVEHAWPPIK